MNLVRRQFLGVLGAAVGQVMWRWGRGGARPAERAVWLDEVFVAGFQYYEGPGLLGRLRCGEHIDLVTEPDNEHDAEAVRVEYGGIKLGYVPRPSNAMIFRMRAQGVRLTCEVAAVNAEARPWEALCVRIAMVGGA